MTNFKYICSLYRTMQMKGYNPMWVYYNFIQEAPNKIEEKDFYNMAKVLGYSKEWATHKVEDWKSDLNTASRKKQEMRAQYRRDRRFSYDE